MNKIYCVVITEYQDDYKCRSGDWSKSGSPSIFSTREKAELFMCKYLATYIDEHEPSLKKIKQLGLEEYFTSSPYLHTHYCTDYNILSELVDHFREGEYVSNTFDWRIDELEVNSDEVTRESLISMHNDAKLKREALLTRESLLNMYSDEESDDEKL